MTRTKYNADYFIAKFSAIPHKLWTTGEFERNGKCCALGHCGERNTGSSPYEANALYRILGSSIAGINDLPSHRYQQLRPRSRILAALRDIKKKEAKK